MLHPSIYMQASVILHGICAAHGFLDGNKRAAWIAAVTFLELNGITLNPINDEIWTDYMVEVAQHIHTEENTAFWLAALDPANDRPLELYPRATA